MTNQFKFILVLGALCVSARSWANPPSAPVSGASPVIALPVAAATPVATMAQIKTLFAEKKADEAVKILKLQHKSLLKSTKDREQVSRWFSLFLFDDTMSTFEKALGLMESKPEEAEAEFKKALAVEPFNKELIQHYASFLIAQGKYKEAQAFLELQLVEQPYMKIYDLYATHAKGLLGQMPAAPNCDDRQWSDVEHKYCYLVQLVLKVLAKEDVITTKNTLEASTVKNLVKKIKLPEGNYWAWRARGDIEELKKYVSLCQSLSDKDKKLYKIVPGVCSKLEEATQQLKSVAIWYPNFKDLPLEYSSLHSY